MSYYTKKSSYVLGLIARLADMPCGWVQARREDFAYISHHPACFVLGGVPVRGIVDIISQDPKYWYRVLRNTFKLPYFSIHLDSKGPGPPSHSLNEDPLEPSVAYTCDICGQVEPTCKK